MAATIKVISSMVLVTGTPDAQVENLPGTAVALAAEEAEGLLARGLVRRADAPAEVRQAPPGPSIQRDGLAGAITREA